MTCKYSNLFLFLLIVTLSFITNGCIHSSKRTFTADKQTQEILSSIQSINTELNTFKGIGSVKLLKDDQESSFRLAWAGEKPDKLRLIILVSGKKLESFAANENSFFLKSYTGAHGFIKQNSSNTSLEKLVSIPIKTNEIISLLSGKIPLKSYKYADTIISPDNQNFIIELSRPWWGVVERLFLDSKKNITGFEILKYGKPLYSVSFSNFKEVNNFKLPFKILIESENASCIIKFSNYYTNPDVDPSMFTLLPDY